MKIAIYGRVLNDKDVAFVEQLLQRISNRGTEVLFHAPYYHEQFKQKISWKQEFATFEESYELIKENVDCLFSIGGDGTMLSAAQVVFKTSVPILGINVGRLGFLTSSSATTSIDDALEALEKKEYIIDRRCLLQLNSDPSLFDDYNFALNEMTLQKKDASSVVMIHVYVDGQFLSSYWADGIIVATPTGSTAYSLSCGGPIIHPSSQTFIITPIAPHNLNVRPIVIPDHKVVSFEIEGRTKQFVCTLDSSITLIDNTYQLSVQKADFSINLIRFRKDSFFKTIRNKLMWGQDVRNIT